ncbi:hypothetical protein [Steroidobacter cummioxidans]|uniref:hypothetical protein n=1 Tax=Steroidobacter cummioxidans TaxID=1803913 RepID=UPI000E324A9F|nr:hypothetical protein [Steroidobacter cummioxidans]
MAIELTFRTRDHSPADGWSRGGEVITETAQLDRVRSALTAGRTLLVKHWHYRGSRCPDLVAVEDFEQFMDYLRNDAVAGDAFDVYDITAALTDETRIVSGKCPDQNEETPRGGAY